MDIESKLKAINTARGLCYISLHNGDLFLIDCDVKRELPDFSSFNPHDIGTYEMTFECIYDREAYVKDSSQGTFLKSIRISQIQGMRLHGGIKL